MKAHRWNLDPSQNKQIETGTKSVTQHTPCTHIHLYGIQTSAT